MKEKKYCIYFLFVILIIIFTACSNLSYDESKTSSIFQKGEVKNCKITEENVIVKGASINGAQEIATLKKNDIVKVLKEIDRWYIVQLKNREIGFIEKNKAEPVVKEGQEPQNPLPTQYPEKEKAPQYNVKPTQSLLTMEEKMIEKINSERIKKDLNPYKVDSELTEVARIKAKDMIENNYFSHYSPTYGSPFEMMDHFDIEYLAAGENLAGNQTVESAHNSLMNSTGHRQNILNEKFTHIGIGIKESEKYGYIFVQMFISKPK